MLRLISAILVLGLASFTAVVLADPPDQAQGRYKATLSGLEEVPAVIAAGTGEATASVEPDGKSIKIQLSYSALTGDPTAIALQLGQRGVGGNAIAYLCGGTAPKCAAGKSGEFEATLTAKEVLPLPLQGVEGGKIEPLIAALDGGVLSINIGTQKIGTGEIRGQFGRGFRGNGEDNGKDKDDKDKEDKDKEDSGKDDKKKEN